MCKKFSQNFQLLTLKIETTASGNFPGIFCSIVWFNFLILSIKCVKKLDSPSKWRECFTFRALCGLYTAPQLLRKIPPPYKSCGKITRGNLVRTLRPCYFLLIRILTSREPRQATKRRAHQRQLFFLLQGVCNCIKFWNNINKNFTWKIAGKFAENCAFKSSQERAHRTIQLSTKSYDKKELVCQWGATKSARRSQVF